MNVEPDRTKPMPYHYGFLRAIAPNYLRVPSVEEQYRYEMRLDRHLRSWRKLSANWDHLDPGANDVRLDASGIALASEVSELRNVQNTVAPFSPVNDDRVPWWLTPTRQIPNLSNFRAPGYAVIADRLKRHAGVALVGSFRAGSDEHERRFAITTDARLIPADKIKPNSGSAFHGYDLRSTGLPVAFIRSKDARSWRLENNRLVPDEHVSWRDFVPLAGTVSELRGKRMVKTRDDRWLESDDLWIAANPSTLPNWATKSVRWIDIGIINQVLVLWEGQRPVYATLVSTGRDGLGDPATTRSTPVGAFRIYQKHVTSTMDSDVADEEFELRDVPWVMYFKGGFALHGAYWHDDFGRARSHGCVNLSPIDARYVFQWSSPQVPEHWHSAATGSEFDEGTLVNIHP
jgi:lipoprotein-anchoring transpeptidase ErfK/SrfK